ncbi:MAG: hypothetical protein WAN03_13825 [Candidatus Sulfotelmatobacter sp.]
MAGKAPTRIKSLMLFYLFGTASVALCQRPTHPTAATFLPDAPSAVSQAQTHTCMCPILDAPRLPGDSAQFDFTPLEYRTPAGEEERHDPFARLFSSHTALSAKRSFHFSTGDSLVGRATYAASKVLLTQDDSGRSHPNTSYFVRVLASAVAHSASRPYWRRTLSQPFSDFGATIGNDAGMNVVHEFEPGILQAMKNHEPKFVSHIEEHFHHK